MKRIQRFLVWAGVLLLLAAIIAVQAAEAALAIVEGPYLQNVTPTSMVVMWQTNQPSRSEVEFGLTSNYTAYADNPSLTLVHEIQLSGLKPDTLYHYRVISETATQSVASADNTFHTAPPAGTPFRFAAYGDSRSQPTVHAAVAKAIIAGAPRLVVHTGDLTGDGDVDGNWQTEFFSPAAPMLARTPFFPAPGNHESNSSLYYSYFDLPDGGGDYNERWYSFGYGDCLFIVIDTNTSYSPGSPQYQWLVKALSEATAEWIFVVQHHPAFSSGTHGGEGDVQTHLVPLYKAYGVDMVFTGHDHLYERSFVVEGNLDCEGAHVSQNVLGPAGRSDGTWADGISLACRNSLVEDNTVIDATDGAIVVFGAPGSIIRNNRIQAVSRNALGGINLVDYHPFGGDFTGTRAEGNRIEASGAAIKAASGWAGGCGSAARCKTPFRAISTA